MKRRELFGSLASAFTPKQELLVRPPYASDHVLFEQECVRCEGKCATVCEEQIIHIGEDKTPRLFFGESGCTYCDECAKVCEYGVLHISNKVPIAATFEIDVVACMSWHHVMCFSCKDPCLEDAIIFNGVFRPEIDTSKCTSCGFCVRVCPTNAIRVEVKQYG